MVKKSHLYPLLFIVVLLLSFYLSQRLYSAWFQLYDDFEIIQGVRSTLIDGVVSTLVDWLREDIGSTGRFRPFYWIHRAIEVKLFGPSPTAWSVYTFLIGIATSLLFYKGLLGLAERPIYAALLTLLFAFGGHSSIWWRLGPAETIASFWFAIAFCFIANRWDQKGYYWKALILVFAALSAMSKESFVVALPWFAVLRFVGFHGGIRAYLVRERWLVIGLGVISLVVMLGILVATNNASGYSAGYGPTLGNLSRTVRDVSINAYLIFACIGMFLCWLNGEDFRSVIRQAIVLSAMLLPQLFLYMKSGLEERYVFPLMFASVTAIYLSFDKIISALRYGIGGIGGSIAALVILIILAVEFIIYLVDMPGQYVSTLLSLRPRLYLFAGIFCVAAFIGARRYCSKALEIAKPLSIALMFLSALVMNYANAAFSANKYLLSSNLLENWLRDVSGMVSTGGHVLIAADPIWHYQWGLSANIFMRDVYGITPRNLYYQHSPEYSNTLYDVHTGQYYEKRFPETYSRTDDYKVIVTPIISEPQFVAEKGKELQLEAYDRRFIPGFDFVTYVKKRELSARPGFALDSPK